MIQERHVGNHVNKVRSNIRTHFSLKVALVPTYFKIAFNQHIVFFPILGERDHLFLSVYRNLISVASQSWAEFSFVTIMQLHNSSC